MLCASQESVYVLPTRALFEEHVIPVLDLYKLLHRREKGDFQLIPWHWHNSDTKCKTSTKEQAGHPTHENGVKHSD